MARRITRKQLKQSDEFVSTMDTVLHWLSENWRPIAAGLVGICAAAAIWWMYGLWSDARSEDASYALNHAVTVYEGEDSVGQLIPTGDPDAAEWEAAIDRKRPPLSSQGWSPCSFGFFV